MSVKTEIKVRHLVLEDLDAVFHIDHEIRKTGEAVTYANLTTESIFTINRHVGRSAKPVSYVDLIRGNVSELLELGFVAEDDGHVRGFILGGVNHIGEKGTEVGIIRIIGVHPVYQHKGIAGKLVAALCDAYHSKGIKNIRINVNRCDIQLLHFVDQMGFDVDHLIEYSKSI
jgi:predicted N-acetyltransferase YhbS